MSGAPQPLEPGTGRLSPGPPRAPRLCLSRSRGTSSFDEPITEPALRLPTGSRKVLFVTGCWKGHGVLLPLLFLARALSPSDGSAPVLRTPDAPSRCGRVPGAWSRGRWERCGQDALCLPTVQRNRCRAGGTVCHRLHGKEWELGDAAAITELRRRRRGSGPGCHRH